MFSRVFVTFRPVFGGKRLIYDRKWLVNLKIPSNVRGEVTSHGDLEDFNDTNVDSDRVPLFIFLYYFIIR